MPLEFANPPFKPKHDWAAVAEELRARPGEWARVFSEGPTSTANAVRQGSIKALPKHSFKVRTEHNRVVNGRKVCDLWLMYNGPA